MVASVLLVLCLTVAFPLSMRAEVPVAVDLGLSVLWADRNLGAGNPEQYGWYFSFAETQPKEKYDWTTYKLCDGGSMFNCHKIGYDNISATEYDAAHVILGDGWRIPTQAECFEMIDVCVATGRFNAEGNFIMDFRSSNGNSISLPMSGEMNGSRIMNDRLEGVYHTSDFMTESGEEDGLDYYLNSPLCFGFDKSDVYKELIGSAHLGIPVRPVKEKKTDVDSVNDRERFILSIKTVDGKTVDANDIDRLEKGIYVVVYSDGCVRKILRNR